MKRFFSLLTLTAGLALAGEVRKGPLHVIHSQQHNGLPGLPDQKSYAEWYQVIVSSDTPGITAFRVTLVYWYVDQEGFRRINTATLAAPVLPRLRYSWINFAGRYEVIKLVIEELRSEPAIEIDAKE